MIGGRLEGGKSLDDAAAPRAVLTIGFDLAPANNASRAFEGVITLVIAVERQETKGRCCCHRPGDLDPAAPGALGSECVLPAAPALGSVFLVDTLTTVEVDRMRCAPRLLPFNAPSALTSRPGQVGFWRQERHLWPLATTTWHAYVSPAGMNLLIISLLLLRL